MVPAAVDEQVEVQLPHHRAHPRFELAFRSRSGSAGTERRRRLAGRARRFEWTRGLYQTVACRAEGEQRRIELSFTNPGILRSGDPADTARGDRNYRWSRRGGI